MPTRLQTGDRIADRYRVVDLVGRGAMGSVYRVEDESTQRTLAIKVMHEEQAEDEKAVRRFEREATAGQAIDDPHVAKVLDSGVDEDTGLYWIAMEFVEGVTLDRFIEQHPELDPSDALDLMRQVLFGLAAAHRVGVVHRDLKVQNIVVSGRVGDPESPPAIKILDFGIAKHLDTETAKHTKPGLGTPLWAAPEQAKLTDEPHPRSDVWAAGLVAFFVLTGKSYWLGANRGASVLDLSMELLRGELDPASVRAEKLGVASAIPEGFDEWFSKTVVRDPQARYADAAEALAALDRLVDRRRAPRYAFWLPVRSDMFREGLAMTHNASDVGLLVVTRSALEPDSKLMLRFEVPPGGSEKYEVPARVVRSQRNTADPEGLWPFQAAIEFEAAVEGLGAVLSKLKTPAVA